MFDIHDIRNELPTRVSFPLLELQIGWWRPPAHIQTSFEIETWSESNDIGLRWNFLDTNTQEKKCIIVASSSLTAIDVYRPYATSVITSTVERAINPPLRLSLELKSSPEFLYLVGKEGRKYSACDNSDFTPDKVGTNTKIHSCECDEMYGPILTQLLLKLYQLHDPDLEIGIPRYYLPSTTNPPYHH